MDKEAEYRALRRAIGEFSTPYETLEEANTAAIKLDALVSTLLKTSFVKRQVGGQRLKELTRGTEAAPVVLREIGGEPFERVALLAARLTDFDLTDLSQDQGGPSWSDIGGAGSAEVLQEANADREALHEALNELLPTVAG